MKQLAHVVSGFIIGYLLPFVGIILVGLTGPIGFVIIGVGLLMFFCIGATETDKNHNRTTDE